MSHPLIDLITSIVPMAVIAVDLVAVTQALSDSFVRRLALAAVGGGWVGLAVYLSASGHLAFSPVNPTPWIGLLLVVPLLTTGMLALTSRKVRDTLLGLPPQLLIALNATRILGILFLLNFVAGTLSGPFPFFAGLGDMITGALAIPIALRMGRSRPPSARTIAVWNAFGALDLLVAVTLGITSVAGSPVQLIHAGVGSQAVQYLPLSLVPTVLVPFYLLTHTIVAAQLRARFRSDQRTLSASAPLEAVSLHGIRPRT